MPPRLASVEGGLARFVQDRLSGVADQLHGDERNVGVHAPSLHPLQQTEADMKKLSERLWDMRVHTPDLDEDDLATLDEAAELARSFEAAPTVKVRGEVGEVCMVPISHDFCGKRVRIVPEREGL